MTLLRNLPYDHPYRWDGREFGGGQLWRPSNLGSALALWLDAEDAASITLNGSTVSQWNDKSGNARHAAQGAAANQPTYTASGLNGKPVLTFDGGDWFNPVTVSLPEFSAMMVLTPTQNTNIIYYPIGFNIDSGDLGTGLSSGGTFFTQRALIWDGSTGVQTAQAIVLNSPMILFGGSNSSGRQISVNGNAPSSDAVAQSISAITIGKRSDSGQYPFVGPIGEVVVTSNLLSTANRQRLEGYYAWKWALEASLPAGHPFKSAPPFV